MNFFCTIDIKKKRRNPDSNIIKKNIESKFLPAKIFLALN